QPIAIGIDNNRIVGAGRSGPRNQRRTPTAMNTVFYPTLMWNSRFAALSGDPFDNRPGFQFPAPEGLSLSYEPQLLVAQAFIPPTERVEAAGYHFPGGNNEIRSEVIRRLNENSNYLQLFTRVFADVKLGGTISYEHFARAIAEFEFTQVYANAPIDRYAPGEETALTPLENKGAEWFSAAPGAWSGTAYPAKSTEMCTAFR